MTGDAVIVWGNCQAPPIADLLTRPLAARGLRVVRVPPVYLASAAEVAEVHETMRSCRFLISQPVSDEYATPGCATSQLAALLPAGAEVITFPIAYDVGPFPYQVHGHDAHDRRVDAPMTDYHDLRVVSAAARGLSVDEALADWAEPAADAVRAVRDVSLAELRRREQDLTVAVSPLLDGPDALWTMTHPTNRVLAGTANALLAAMGLDRDVVPPAVEYLGQRRAPVDAATATALGWPAATARRDWVIDGRAVGIRELLDVQLAFYRDRPDVVTRTMQRQSVRLTQLNLSG